MQFRPYIPSDHAGFFYTTCGTSSLAIRFLLNRKKKNGLEWNMLVV